MYLSISIHIRTAVRVCVCGSCRFHGQMRCEARTPCWESPSVGFPEGAFEGETVRRGWLNSTAGCGVHAGGPCGMSVSARTSNVSSHVLSWSSRAPEELGCVGIQELELSLRLSWGWSHIHFRGILCSLGFCLAFLRSNLPMVCEHEGPSPRPLKQETGNPLNLRPQKTRKQMAQNTGNICAKTLEQANLGQEVARRIRRVVLHKSLYACHLNKTHPDVCPSHFLAHLGL